MGKKSSFLLRLWALRQFFHDCRHGSWDDIKISFREHVWKTFLRGHLNIQPFIGLEDDHPEVYSSEVVSTDTLLEVAEENLRHYRELGLKRGGQFPRYVEVQHSHFLACARCRDFACKTIMEDASLKRETERIIRDAFAGQ